MKNTDGRRKYPLEIRDKMRKMRAEGVSIRKIAKELGCSKALVQKSTNSLLTFE